MKTNNLFSFVLLLMTGAVLFVFSCCNKNDDDILDFPPLYRIGVGDYITWKDEVGTMRLTGESTPTGQTEIYIEDIWRNRYYIAYTNNEEMSKLMIEGLRVKFRGKVFGVKEEYAEKKKWPNDVNIWYLVQTYCFIEIMSEEEASKWNWPD